MREQGKEVEKLLRVHMYQRVFCGTCKEKCETHTDTYTFQD